jgi:tetratricopeptide (TPR) repeat protein
MYVGVKNVQESRQQVLVARAQRDSAVGEMQTAIAAKNDAEAARLRIEQQITELKKEKQRVEEENKKLLAEADPQTIIARVKKELADKAPRFRSDSLYKQGRDVRAAGNLNLAYELYLAARDEDPSYVWPHIGLGNVAVDRSDFHIAEKHFARAVAVDPNEPDAMYNLASVTARLKKWDKAEEYARKVLILDPKYTRVQRLLVDIAEGRRFQEKH